MSYKVCHCALAGTDACRNCSSNGPWMADTYIDLVPVVMCKDCRYASEEKWGDISTYYCRNWDATMTANDYCSEGMRNEY